MGVTTASDLLVVTPLTLTGYLLKRPSYINWTRKVMLLILEFCDDKALGGIRHSKTAPPRIKILKNVFLVLFRGKIA